MSHWLGAAIKEQTNADFGLINRKGMRQGLAAGKLTKANVYDVIPFENSVVVARLAGADLIKAFENPEARVIGAQKKGAAWVDSKGKAMAATGRPLIDHHPAAAWLRRLESQE